MIDTSVKWMNNGMAGSPQVSNVWGQLTSFLDSVLVYGFGLKIVTTAVCNGEVLTLNIPSGHSYLLDQVIKLSGVTNNTAFNKEYRVLSKTNVQVTCVAEGLPNLVLAGSMSVIVAPLGFEIVFSRDYKRVYRSLNSLALGNMLVVYDGPRETEYDISWAKWASVGIAREMTDVDTIIGAQAPYDGNAPSQNWASSQVGHYGWYKWYFARTGGYETNGNSGGGNRNWVLVGDDRGFYLSITNAPGFSWYGRVPYMFGDLDRFKSGDNYATYLRAADNYWSNSNGGHHSYPGQLSGYGGVMSCDVSGGVLLRGPSQIGNPVRWGITSLNTNNGQQVTGRGGLPWPNDSDYSMWLLDCFCRQENGGMRGMMPGLFWVPHWVPHSDQTIVTNVVNQPDKRFLLVKSSYSNEAEGATWAYDLTGPWVRG